MSTLKIDPSYNVAGIATSAGAIEFHYSRGHLIADCPQEALDAAGASYDHADYVQGIMVKLATVAVQEYLDTAAQARGYDDIFTAISYATSTHTTFGPEGTAFRDWRDEVWTACHTTLETWLAGGDEPELEEVLQALPAFTG